MPVVFQYNADVPANWWHYGVVVAALLCAMLVMVGIAAWKQEPSRFKRISMLAVFVLLWIVSGFFLLAFGWSEKFPLWNSSSVVNAIQNSYKVDGITDVTVPTSIDNMAAYDMIITSSMDHKPYLCQYRQTVPTKHLVHPSFPHQRHSLYEVDGKLMCSGTMTALQHR